MDILQQTTLILSIDFNSLEPRTSVSQNALSSAHSLVGQLEEDPARRQLLDSQSFLQIVWSVQRLAFLDADHGHEAALAEWCERQWADRLQKDPDDVESHLGIARSWLLKAQQSLSQIEQREGAASQSSSDSSGNSRTSGRAHGLCSIRRLVADTERVGTPDYVQARDMLRPCLEHFDRALTLSYRRDRLTGEILEMAAEAYIHFGNVSHPRNNELCYQRALHCLRLASEKPGHHLDENLEEDYIVENRQPWYQATDRPT